MFVAQLTAREEAEADEAEVLEDEHDVHHFVHCVGEGAGVDGVSGWVGAVEFGRWGRHCWEAMCFVWVGDSVEFCIGLYEAIIMLGGVC